MPSRGFKWTNEKLETFFKTLDDSDVGFLVMVDIEYPNSLLDFHNGLLLTAEKKIGEQFFSPYQCHFKNYGTNTKKLMKIFLNKTEYTCHY